MQRPGLWKSFHRAQLSSLAATVVDFGTLVFLVEVGGVWYVAATAIGAALGAVTNFLLGRHWSFKASHDQAHWQAVRYAIVSGGSLVLNSAGVYFFTDLIGIRYFESKVVTALLVGVLFNFPLHRAYVFR
jgi:putative flippase GtrA